MLYQLFRFNLCLNPYREKELFMALARNLSFSSVVLRLKSRNCCPSRLQWLFSHAEARSLFIEPAWIYPQSPKTTLFDENIVYFFLKFCLFFAKIFTSSKYVPGTFDEKSFPRSVSRELSLSDILIMPAKVPGRMSDILIIPALAGIILPVTFFGNFSEIMEISCFSDENRAFLDGCPGNFSFLGDFCDSRQWIKQ